MRVAVLGVGLVGGSIGLASRRRLRAEVTGFDPDTRVVERALELGALDTAAETPAAAAANAELVFCAAPVAALPDLAGEALAASDDAVVSDVGSTKRGVVEAVTASPAAERFIGGHPLAGAEAAGIEHARAELFDGARWFLTPAPGASGVHYERLQRALAELGARPQAIDADSHDRLMATISHLPHVLANVLVAQGRAALAEEAERLPEVGPSFRDATRVAGANPAIWEDIFAANGPRIAAEVDAVAERLREAGELLRSGDAEGVARWHGDAGRARRELLESDLAGGELHELRLSVENRPGTVAEIALALGRAGVNIEDMALYPAADMRTGAISLWVAGAADAERAVAVVRDLGHAVSNAGRGAA